PPPPGASASPPWTASSAQAGGEPALLAVGRAGGGFVPVPPGVVTLLVQLDPPERIGPFLLRAGDAARVRILEEATGAGAPVRTWRLERGDEAVGRAFPPPETLPGREP
ncbi:MAG: hypothetical protein DCC71_25880, partial [Proteobacteria bacterium]